MGRVIQHPSADIRPALEAALRRLPGRGADVETHIQAALATFLDMHQAHQQQPETPARFRHFGRARARKQLDTLAEYSDKLAEAIDASGVEVVRALADLPPGENWLQPWSFANELRRRAAQARRADVSRMPVKGETRPANYYVKAVAGNAMTFYSLVTGGEPRLATNKNSGKDAGKANGPFVEFLTVLFAVMQIDASVDAVARAAHKKMRKGPPPVAPTRHPAREAAHTPQPDWAVETAAAILTAIDDYRQMASSTEAAPGTPGGENSS